MIINSTITPNMTFTKTSQKFGQWADSRANTVFGLGFPSEQQLTKVTGLAALLLLTGERHVPIQPLQLRVLCIRAGCPSPCDDPVSLYTEAGTIANTVVKAGVKSDHWWWCWWGDCSGVLPSVCVFRCLRKQPELCGSFWHLPGLCAHFSWKWRQKEREALVCQECWC